MKVYKSAVIGCGNIHRNHIKGINDSPLGKLTAVCDIDQEAADKSASENGVPAFYSLDELLKFGDFDVLHICTPHYLHASMAIKAMRQGKHIICEKPMAIHSADAREMIKVAEETGVQLGVCFQNRYNSSSIYVKELLESSRMGKILGARGIVTWDRSEAYYASGEWRGKIATEGGGVLINQAIHTLDLLQWFVDSPVKELKASISTKRLQGVVETEDTADALIFFENGVRGVFFASLCYTSNSPVMLELECENGSILLADKLTVKINGEEDIVLDINRPSCEKDYWGSGHTCLIHDFYKSLSENKPFAIDGEEGIKAVEIVEAIYDYARK